MMDGVINHIYIKTNLEKETILGDQEAEDVLQVPMKEDEFVVGFYGDF